MRWTEGAREEEKLVRDLPDNARVAQAARAASGAADAPTKSPPAPPIRSSGLDADSLDALLNALHVPFVSNRYHSNRATEA